MDLSKSGKRIKEMRNKKGLTQTQLASMLSNGVETDRGKSKISEYEHGKNLTLRNIQDIAKALACDPDYLLGCIEHPDKTTSWIAEQIPLSRDAIEALKYLNNETDSYYQIIAISILNSLIIGIAEETKRKKDSTVLNDAINLEITLEQISDYEATGSKFNEHPEMNPREYAIGKIAIEGLSTKMGIHLSKYVIDALRKQK